MGATVDKPFFMRNEKRIYTITDPPHLLKAVRNSLLTHYIISNGERVDWDHFKKFAALDSANAARIAPKLNDVHLMENPTTFQKMRVNTAAQTLSSSVAAGLFTLARLVCENALLTINLFSLCPQSFLTSFFISTDTMCFPPPQMPPPTSSSHLTNCLTRSLALHER